MGNQEQRLLDNESFGESRGVSPEELAVNLCAGHSVAAQQLHDLYALRLLGVVRQRMNPAFRRRVDPEDVVQSAFGSFFRVLVATDWRSHRGGERVWCMLYAITLNKLRAQIRFHAAEKRSVRREEYWVDAISEVNAQHAETIFVDELETVMRDCTSNHRKILELLMSGKSEAQVADAMQCSLRTVYRVVERVSDQLQSRLSD